MTQPDPATPDPAARAAEVCKKIFPRDSYSQGVVDIVAEAISTALAELQKKLDDATSDLEASEVVGKRNHSNQVFWCGTCKRRRSHYRGFEDSSRDRMLDEIARLSTDAELAAILRLVRARDLGRIESMLRQCNIREPQIIGTLNDCISLSCQPAVGGET